MKRNMVVVVLCGLLYASPAVGQQDKVSLLLYGRLISDAAGNWRVDENIVLNTRLNKWLRGEFGIRQGERPRQFDSYYHYKVELQTRNFWNRVKFIARLSDNVIKYPSPIFSRSNYLVIAEARFPIAGKFSLLTAYGYVFSYTRSGSQEAIPSAGGSENFYSTWKLALRYALGHKGHAQAVWGAYDVFNPYVLQSPFFQLDVEYDLSERIALYSYFRYQYDHQWNVPLNNFLGLGVRVHVVK
jgi:hypothetical protein